jgi:hypothetical protein
VVQIGYRKHRAKGASWFSPAMPQQPRAADSV